jgi:hypothetical protein
MVMIFRHPVKSFQAAAKFKLLNLAVFGKNFKVAIYRPQADARKTPANHLIYLIRAGMCIRTSKFFQDDLALSRHPEVGLI